MVKPNRALPRSQVRLDGFEITWSKTVNSPAFSDSRSRKRPWQTSQCGKDKKAWSQEALRGWPPL